jgi:hypothetical protein
MHKIYLKNNGNESLMLFETEEKLKIGSFAHSR